MFEVESTEIQKLNDSDLRELIARLCKAELEKNGISPKYVTWGGKQTAPDVGQDVTVEIPSTITSGYIQRSHTVFQVKALSKSMNQNKIEREMMPKGVIRPIFSNINDNTGAYIIANSGDDLGKKSLDAKKSKIDEVLDQNQLTQIKTDFFCSRKIADWVETFPALVVWVKKRCGFSFSSWKPYDNWSNPKLGLDAKYIIDNKARIEHQGNLETVENGISLIREQLSASGKSLRIIGKFGVGKTRFLQTLFDKRIGHDAPSAHMVVYADLGDSPSPEPSQVAEYLIKAQKPMIIVLDNCSSSVHEQITKICTHARSTVSVITVEHDVTEDEPDETEIFKLGDYSDEAIEGLLPIWNQSLTYDSSQKITTLSGGNARVAKLLCGLFENCGDVTSLTGKEIFERLFWQGNDKNDELLKVAEACSLVCAYEDDGQNCDEISLLASIAEINVRTFRLSVAELKKRDVLQTRNIQNALLPHALANRLAEKTLGYFTPNDKVFESPNFGRLKSSFIKRLSYLYDDEKAIKIASRMIDETAAMTNGHRQSKDTEDFGRLASIVPSGALKFIEDNINCITGRSNGGLVEQEMARIAVDTAYDNTLFDRAVNVLFVLYSNSKYSQRANNTIRHEFEKLFEIGPNTRATPEQRGSYVKLMLLSGDTAKQAFGIALLNATLKTRWHNKLELLQATSSNATIQFKFRTCQKNKRVVFLA